MKKPWGIVEIESLLAIGIGLIGFLIVTFSEVPASMSGMGFMGYWLIPISPSIVLIYLGAELQPSNSSLPTNAKQLLGFFTLPLLGSVIVSIYFMLMSDDSVRRTAFAWSWYQVLFVLFPLGVRAGQYYRYRR